MSRRFLLTTGAVVAGGAGYYLYNAGGDASVAEKQFERDASKLSSKVRSDLPGKGKEAEKNAQVAGEKAGSKLDNAFDSLKDSAGRAEQRFDEYRKETGKNLTAAVDKFDKKVDEGTAKSKSWVSGWFGGGK